MKWGVRKDPQRSQRKREYKLETYKNKLLNKASRRASKGRSRAKEFGAEYKDLQSKGMRSESWSNEVKSRGERYINEQGAFWGSISTIIEGNNKEAFNTYKSDVKSGMDSWNSYARKWTQRKKNLMNMPIGEFTTKKDIRKVYRGR